MKRQRATQLLEGLLNRAAEDTWPAKLVRSVYVFGSYARGALEPRDVDVAVDFERDDRWLSHHANSMSYGYDPYAILKQALRGRQRGMSFVFERNLGGYDDIPMTLVWERGEALSIALDRLAALPVDPHAGRAPRDAMIPCFAGMEHSLRRYVREGLVELIDDGTISVERMVLADAVVSDPANRWEVERRWKTNSPLFRAASAVLGHFESQGIDLHTVHLHGRDLGNSTTPYFAGFQLRYLHGVIRCFAKFGGVEWIEVPHPTRSKPLLALRIHPLDRGKVVRHNEDRHLWLS